MVEGCVPITLGGIRNNHCISPRSLHPALLLDKTAPPQFLSNSVQLDLRRKKAKPLVELERAIRQAPKHRNEIPPMVAGTNADLLDAITQIYYPQHQELENMTSDRLTRAAEMQA